MRRRRLQSKYVVDSSEKTHEIPDDLIKPDPRRVLMLEDDPGLANLLREFLEGHNFLVTHVLGGAEGVQRILAVDFDVILCDMVMPGFPGDMFYRAVERARPHLCRRFIFMTGHRGDSQIDSFIRSVRGLMLWKPFQFHELMDAVRTVLRKTASAAT
jgi:DNA-binding response OmpR family regulator